MPSFRCQLERNGFCAAASASWSCAGLKTRSPIAINIRAVILGSAINNDGARKVGYLAPSVEGQAEVIAEALEYAGVAADEHLLR